MGAAAGEDWPERAQQVHQWTTEANEQKAVLRATRGWFADNKADRVASKALADYISAHDTLPLVSPKDLAKRMKGYGVEPRKISHMYYFKADLAPVWAEWLTD